MMENSMIEQMMDIDLNQEPLEPLHDSMPGLGSIFNDVGDANGRIVERIRQLEAISARAMQRQRHQQGQINTDELRVSMANIHIEGNIAFDDQIVGSSKSCKRDSSHLVAKALDMDTNVNKEESNGGGFFDCNICLDMAREPILTCCGHLFCWPCFFKVPYVQSDLKECPVCKGEVSSKTITPIYGSSNKTGKSKTEESCMKIPPRPHARRSESMKQRLRVRRARQQRINLGFSTIQIAEALRQAVTDGTDHAGEQILPMHFDSLHITSERNNSRTAQLPSSERPPGAEAESSRRLRVIQLSRLLSQQAASLSSLSSALNSVESIVEEFEAVVHGRPMRSNHAQDPPVDDRNFLTRSTAFVHPDSETSATAADAAVSSAMHLSSAAQRILEELDATGGDLSTRRNHEQASTSNRRDPFLSATFNLPESLSSSSSGRNDLSSPNLHAENEATDTAVENFTDPTSIFPSRTNVSRAHALRRRRLR